MPPFEVHRPTTVADAVALKAGLPDSLYVAGGTDLLPNLKHELHRPKHLVSLADVQGFGAIEPGEGGFRIGAGTTLHALSENEAVRTRLPGLARAASLVAGPQHRRMGTLGGNVMLDTRCLFYNQSQSWREALGYCLKAEGDWCHVIGSDTTCVAAHSADTVPVLMAMDARLVFEDSEGSKTILMRDLHRQDGRYDANPVIGRQALLVAVVVPPQPEAHRSTYRKVRQRAAVDFPQLGIGLCGAFAPDGTVLALSAAVSAVMPKPKLLQRMDEAVGTRLEDEVVGALAEAAYRQVKPQKSLCGSPEWRRHMVRVEMRRGLMELRTANSGQRSAISQVRG